MNSKLGVAIILIFFFMTIDTNGQVFFQESFESETGWTLSHSFDNGGNKYIKRDSFDNFPGLSFNLAGQDGMMVIGAENTDANEFGAPEDGFATIEFDDIDISGRTNLECVVSVACNDQDQSYDDRVLDSGDLLDFEISVDNSVWVRIGAFNSVAGSDGNSALYHDANNNGDGGEIGEAIVDSTFTDYVFPIATTGTTLSLRAVLRMTESAEEIVFDNVRLKESTGDEVAPTINNVQLLGNQTLKVFFNEPMSSTANITAFYTQISNLGSVDLSNGNLEATLNYTQPFEIGTEYDLVIFGLSDPAGNSMEYAYLQTFYYNPTTPELIVSEIMYNDPNVADTLEYIEVYNNGTDDIQLGGLIITGAVDFTFPTNILAPGAYYLIARRPSSANAFYGEAFGNYSGSLPNSGGTIILRNTLGQNVDFILYENSLPWPPAGNGSGASIELVNYDGDNNVGNNWIGASNGIGFVNGDPIFGTPGFGPSITLPVVQFVQDEYSINEIDGTVEIGINISASNSSTSSLTLSYGAESTGDVMDVTLTGNESVSFTANFNEILTITLPITNDTNLEGYEFINLQIGGLNNASLGLNSTAVILINDDEYVAPTLFINELQSSNLSDVTDEFGQFDDWFEIYNPNNFDVDLAGYYFTDNAQNPIKFRVAHGNPSVTTVPAESWLLFWADEDGGQGPLHTNFRLSSTGEFLSLRAPNSTTIVDQIAFDAITPNSSFGRETDGNINWIFFNNTTPGESNGPDGVDEIGSQTLTVYPNPATDFIYWDIPADATLYDIYGRKMKKVFKSYSFNLNEIPNGIYILQFADAKYTSTKVVISR